MMFCGAVEYSVTNTAPPPTLYIDTTPMESARLEAAYAPMAETPTAKRRASDSRLRYLARKQNYK
jgi:hypothetical protein